MVGEGKIVASTFMQPRLRMTEKTRQTKKKQITSVRRKKEEAKEDIPRPRRGEYWIGKGSVIPFPLEERGEKTKITERVTTAKRQKYDAGSK